VAYVAFRQKPGAEKGVYDSDLFLLDKGGEPNPVPLGDGLPTERSAWSALPVRIDGGRLAWSPDGGRLFARLRLGVRFHWRHFVRSGIIERDGRMRVSVTSAFGDEFGEDGWIGWGRTVWGARGARFVTLLDRGDWKPLVLVASADGVATDLVSDDRSSKWSPAIEPNGRRVAYFASSIAWTRGQAFPPTIRIVDRLSPTVIDLPLGADGLKPNGLSWTPDGSRLLYELIADTAKAGIYAQTVPSPSPAVGSPRPCPPLATLIAEAFESDEVSVLGWAVDRARESWTAELGPSVERALHRWAGRGDYESKDERSRLLDLVRAKVLRAALPDVLLAANATDTGFAAIETVSEWLGEDAPAALDPFRTTAADAGLRAMAAAEMVRRGDPRGWETLAKFPKGESSALWILARVDDPRAIDLLIECLPSVERVASGNMFGTPEVGDLAELMLARRTGKTFDRDQVKWTAWWNDEAKRVRPDVPERNPAVDAFYAGSRERERRTAERR
jgi:hypothetical protein